MTRNIVDVDKRVMSLIMTKNMCDLDFCGGRRSRAGPSGGWSVFNFNFQFSIFNFEYKDLQKADPFSKLCKNLNPQIAIFLYPHVLF